jgi:hypothetical protein
MTVMWNVTLPSNKKWKKCRGFACYNVHKKLSQFNSVQYIFKFHSSWETNFQWNFVINDGLCPNLTLCGEINAHINDTII